MSQVDVNTEDPRLEVLDRQHQVVIFVMSPENLDFPN